MDIRSFFGAGGVKKDSTKKQEHKSKKSSEEVTTKKDLPGKSVDSRGELAKSSEKKVKKDETKIVREMSDEEVDFKKSRKRSRSGKRKSEDGKVGVDRKEKESSREKEKESLSEKRKDDTTKKRMEKKSKVLDEEDEEDEDVMNVRKKHKTVVLDSESEEEEPLPKSIRDKKRKSSLNDSPPTNSIAKAFTQVVPKTSEGKHTEAPKKKEARKLVNALDFFGASPITRKDAQKDKRDVEKEAKKEKKDDEITVLIDEKVGGKHDEKKNVKNEKFKSEKDEEKTVSIDERKKRVDEKKERLDDDEDEEDEVIVETPVKSLSEKLALKMSKSGRMEGVKERVKEEKVKEEKGKKEGMVKKDLKDLKKEEKEEKVKKEGMTKKENKEEMTKKEKKEEMTKKEKKEEVTKKENKEEVTKKENKEEVTKKENKEDKGMKEEGKKEKRRNNEEMDEGEEEDEEEMKKKKMRMSYAAFKQREPPKALGSREIPKGEDNCLEGLTFVLTGVYETVERDEVKGMVQRLGGKVTTSVSRNTNYLVAGRDPGMSKVDKATQLGTKQIDEDALFELVSGMPGKKSKYEIQAEKEVKSSKTSTPSSAKKATKAPIEYSSQDSSAESTKTTSKESTTPTQKASTLTQQATASPAECLLWTDKYRPVSLKQLVGQQGPKSPANKLLAWLQQWEKNSLLKPIFGRTNEDGVGLKAALLSGPPGVGKTTSAQVVCKELNFSFIELNASDTRSKRSLKEEVSECLNNQSLITLFGGVGESGEEMRRHCVVMDEVDGMSGNEDRGGMQELIQLIKTTHIPIICLCNDRNHPKIRSLANHCFDLRFQRPRVEQIKSAIMTIAYKEHVKMPPSSLNDIITSANHDLRQILLNLSMWTVQESSPTYEQLKKHSDNAKKDLHYSPFDVCRKVFSNDQDRRKLSLRDKSDLFFHDYNIASLFVQENYLSVAPTLARGDTKRHLALLSKAADAMCEGDVVDARIRKHQAWSLLPLQAMYASVLPGEYMRGGVGGMVQFPSWLGKNSTTNKNDRLLQELNLHTRISIKGNKQSLNQDYLPAFKHLLTAPLINNDPTPTLDLMTSYDLLRDDLENIRELTNWSNAPDLFGKIDSKTKANLTRQFNKQCHLTPYSTSTVKKATKRKMAEDGEEEDDDGGADDVDDDDPNADAMIVKKAKKASKGKQAPKEAPKKGKGATKDKKKK